MDKLNPARGRRRKLFELGTSVVTLGLALPAATLKAQTNGGTSGPQLEEVVVTALKADVSVQDAPTTVNVVSGDMIQSQGITAVEQLTSAVPGLRINQAPGGTINPVVRGLGSSPSNNSFEQTIGLFVDGIFAGHPREYSSALFDIERVELLKGTQAAVVGKNTSVGAISLVTAKPDLSKPSANVSYFHEFELGGDTADAAFNLPVNEQLGLRLAAMGSEEDGWVKNVLNGNKEEPSTKRYASRLSLRFRPSDSLDWTVYGQYSRSELDGQLFHFGYDALGNGARAAANGGDTGFVIRRYESRWSPRPGGFDAYGFSEPGSETDAAKFNSTLEYDFGAGAITSITGYGRYTDTYLIDASALVNNPVLRGGREKDETFSQELRYASSWDGSFNLLTGVYYYWDEWEYGDQSDFNGAQLVAPPLGGAFRQTYTQTTETASAFAQGTYDVTNSFKVIGGVRFEHFAKEGDFTARTIIRPGGLTAVVYGAYPAFKRDDSENYFDYSVQLQYFITPDINTYASFATGTKGFGYVATPTAPGGVLTDPFYKTEESKTTEVGLKASLGGTANLNVALFNTEIKDYQIGINLGSQFLIRNDQIRSRGVEASFDVMVVEGLTASLVTTYADVEKQDPKPANSISSLPFSPKWSGMARLAYTTPFGNALRFKGDISAEFRSEQYLSDVGDFVYPPSEGRAIVDLRLALAHESAGWEIAAVGRNILDEYTVGYAFNSFGTAGGIQIAEERPRTVGLQVSYKFD